MFVKDPPAASTGAAAEVAAPAVSLSFPARLPSPPVIAEIPLTAFPPTLSSGPATTAIPAHLRITSCISGLRLPQPSLRAWTPEVRPPSTSVIRGPAASTRSAPRSFISFIVVVILSMGSRAPLKVVSTESPQSSTELEKSSKDSLPSWTAAAIAGPAFAPKSSMAACAASVSLPAPAIFSCRSASASPIDWPSFVAFCSAFLSPAITAELSTPLFSRFARKPIDVLMS